MQLFNSLIVNQYYKDKLFEDICARLDQKGVDLCEDYIITALKLSELVGLSDRTDFIHADALDLPFEDSSFEVVWTQHVQMNIEDKEKFYAEIDRVLMDEGALVYYDIFKKKDEEVNYK